jgi:tetratricopeptide (TPR) repeat protein
MLPYLESQEPTQEYRRMATKRRVVKKDIKRDPLVTYTLKVTRYAQEHFTPIIIGVVALIVVIAVVVFTANSRRTAAYESETRLAEAMALYGQKNYESAKAAFQQVADIHGGRNRAVAQYYKAQCEFLQHNYGQALADYEDYLQVASDFPEFESAALYAAALCQEGLGDVKRAAEMMERAHQSFEPSDPRYLTSAFQAGELFAMAGDSERAAKYYQTVADEATGTLQEKATAAIALLEQR